MFEKIAPKLPARTPQSAPQRQIEAPGIVPAIRKETLPRAVQTAIRDMIAPFAMQRPVDNEERASYLKAFAKAVDGFHEQIALLALDHLILHNPRNPFPPTAQDVHELCSKIASSWQSRVLGYYIHDMGWSQYSIPAVASPGGEPGTEDCRIPWDMVVFWVAGALPAACAPSSDAPCGSAVNGWSQEQFDRIPVSAWPEGLRGAAVESRARYREAELARQKRAEFLSSLSREVAVEFGRVELLTRRTGEHLSDAEILERAEAALAENRARAARAAAERAESQKKQHEAMEIAARNRDEQRKQQAEMNRRLDEWLAIPEGERPDLSPELADTLRLRRIRSSYGGLANTRLVREGLQ